MIASAIRHGKKRREIQRKAKFMRRQLEWFKTAGPHAQRMHPERHTLARMLSGSAK